ncbi:hypothetical protein Y863_08945, partial [Campylobacter jejuni CVM 41905]
KLVGSFKLVQVITLMITTLANLLLIKQINLIPLKKMKKILAKIKMIKKKMANKPKWLMA